MSVPAKLGAFVAVLAVVFAAAFGLGNAVGGPDDTANQDRSPATTAPAGPHADDHDEDGS